MKIYTADEIRRVEEVENEIGTKFIRLMENAGAACSVRTAKYAASRYSENISVCIVCGKGKNGGDGFVIARKLNERGFKVSVVMALGAPTAPDAVEMYTKAVSCGIGMTRYDREREKAERVVLEADVIVDCIFGIGFHGAPSDVCAEVFELVNRAPGKVVAVDVPSGVNTDTGAVEGACVRADVTLAITVLKPAHVLLPARTYCGKTELVEIGISDEAMNSVSPKLMTLDKNELEAVLPLRDVNAHKNDSGHVLCICGSVNMPGAARLCSAAAVYAGAGLVTAAFPKSAYPALAAGLAEVMLLPLSEDENGGLSADALPLIFEKAEKANAVVIGCGLGTGAGARTVVSEVIKKVNCPVVIDADGLNAIADCPDVLKESKADIIITPHPGELSRLTGLTAKEIEADRQTVAGSFAKEYGVTVLLKGPATVVASNRSETKYINRSGNPGLAKGGSGDVLSGIIGGFLAQGLRPFTAACAGAFVHGCAADCAAAENSINGMKASDLFDGIKTIYKEFGR